MVRTTKPIKRLDTAAPPNQPIPEQGGCPNRRRCLRLILGKVFAWARVCVWVCAVYGKKLRESIERRREASCGNNVGATFLALLLEILKQLKILGWEFSDFSHVERCYFL